MRHLLLLCVVCGCGYAAQGAAGSRPAPETLLLFGGPGHKTYLGCFCGLYGTESIFNQYGRFGSRYSAESISNRYGQFGSAYSTYSACSRYASDPPIIVTRDGRAVGRLTLNAYSSGAIKDPDLLAWLEKTVCED